MAAPVVPLRPGSGDPLVAAEAASSMVAAALGR